MTHTEEIQVYKQTKVANGSGGFTTTNVLQADAPTWATIKQVSGDVALFSTRDDIESFYDVFVNYKDDFTWSNDMYIVSRFGNLQVNGITETIRKRQYKLRTGRIG